MADPLLADPYGLYVVAEQAKDPATALVPLIEEASSHKLTARAVDKKAAQRKDKARLAHVNAAFCFWAAPRGRDDLTLARLSLAPEEPC